MNSGSASTWSAQDDETLRRLHRKGLTFAQMCSELGRSRNAILGRAHRLKLTARKTIAPKDVNKIRIAATRTRQIRGGVPSQNKLHAGNIRGKKEGRKFDPGLRETAPAVDVARVHLENLNSGHCKYPIGDPREDGFGFCGAHRLPGYPYCSRHCEVAFINFQCEAA